VKTKHRWLLVGALAAFGCGSDKKDSIYDGLTGDGGKSSRSNKDGGSDAKASGDEDVCGKHNVVSKNAVPDMLIVLDRSGSMSPLINGHTDRWKGSATAVAQLTEKYSAGVNFGLMTFPGDYGLGGGGGFGGGGFGGIDTTNCTTGAVNVAIGRDRGPAINQAIASMGPNGRTPTAATLKAALDVIGAPQAGDQALSGGKYVLLVTDGDPNCSTPTAGVNGPDFVARQQTIDAIKALTDAGVKTYVVGYETAGTDFAGALDMMAAAGGTGEAMHRSVESAEDLEATFDELAANATTCSYTLSEKVDPTFVSVTVGSKGRKYQDADGWTLASNGRTVTLTGKACSDAKGGQVFTVEVECEPVIAF
jgi:Mg-chelatase subunit ChlD